MHHRRIELPAQARTVVDVLGEAEPPATVTASPEDLHDRLTGGAPFGHPAWDHAMEAFDDV